MPRVTFIARSHLSPPVVRGSSACPLTFKCVGYERTAVEQFDDLYDCIDRLDTISFAAWCLGGLDELGLLLGC